MILVAAAAGYGIWVWVAGGTAAVATGAGAGVGAYFLTKFIDKDKTTPSPVSPTDPHSSTAVQYEQTINIEKVLTEELSLIASKLGSKDFKESIVSTMEKLNEVHGMLMSLKKELIGRPEFSVFLNEFMGELKTINKKMEIYYDELLANQELFEKTLSQDGPAFIRLSKVLGKTIQYTEILETQIAQLQSEKKELVKKVAHLKAENQSLRDMVGQANRSATPVIGFFKSSSETPLKPMLSVSPTPK